MLPGLPIQGKIFGLLRSVPVLFALFVDSFSYRLPAAVEATNCAEPAGSWDDSFFRPPLQQGVGGSALGTAELPDGRILVAMAGSYTSGGPMAVERALMARLHRDGTLDPTFTFQSTNLFRVWTIHALAVAVDGTIAAGSSGYGTDGFFYGHIHIVDADGRTAFAAYTGTDNSQLVRSLAWQTDGRLLVAGNFRAFLPAVPPGLARFLNDGTVDLSFTPPTNFTFVSGVAVQPDAKILTMNEGVLYRLLSNGTPDPSFFPPQFERLSYDGNPHSPLPLILQPDGKILVGWSFVSVNGVRRSSVARLNADGTLDPSFDPGSGPAGGSFPEMDLTLQSDGKIIVAGHFASFNGLDRHGLVRLHSDGSVDASFDSGSQFEFVRSVTALRDGKFLATGSTNSLVEDMSPYRLLGDPTIRLEAPEFITRGELRLRFSAVPAESYVLQSTIDLRQWLDIATNVANDCWLQFTNAVSDQPALFYRVRRPSEFALRAY